MKIKELVMLLVLQCCLTAHGIKIAAYNVRIFGTSKLQNTVAMNMITQIVRQYDIIVIQEVRGFNTPTEVPNGVLQWVNQPGNDYAICNSAYNYKPTTSSHRELYLYLYRTSSVTCLGTEEAEAIVPGYSNAFRRPPTVARFRLSSSSGNIDFFVVGIHTQPQRAVPEINSLVNVYNTFSQRYGTIFGFIMGDFNYGGTYVPSSQLDNLNIDSPPFVRFINKTDGTTLKPFNPTPQNPKKPYDRIYVVPRNSQTFITSVGIDTFRDMLTESQYYSSVSDHYPVYVDVNIGTNGGTAPSDFQINKNEYIAAVTEECKSVEKDYDPEIDDDLEGDFYKDCTSVCSMVVGTTKRQLLPTLDLPCLLANETNRSQTVTTSIFVVLLLALLSMSL